VAAMSTHFDQRSYPAVDAADKESCRPDFAIALYPGHLWKDDGNFKLNPNVPVTTNTPPTFLVQAEDDHVDGVEQSLVYYMALKNAGVPVEMHFACARRACIWAAAHEVSDYGLAPVGGDVAGDDRDDSGSRQRRRDAELNR